MISLLHEYLEEKCGVKSLTSESGFITYRFEPEFCFLADIFVSKQSRGTKEGSELLKRLETICRSHGIFKIRATVDTTLPLATETVMIAMVKGFRLKETTQRHLIIEKELD